MGRHHDLSGDIDNDDDVRSGDGQPSDGGELNDREIMIILFTILGVVLVLAVVVFVLKYVCRRWFGRTCRIIWERDNQSSTAVGSDIEGVIICDSQPRGGKMSEGTDFALFGSNGCFTPTPDDPIYTIPFSGQPSTFNNWEFGERIHPTAGNTFPGQNHYTYDGQLRLPPSSSSVSIKRAGSAEVFQEDHRLEELHRAGMTQSETIMVGGKLVVFISREVSHLGDTLVLTDMGISLTIPPYAIEAGCTELISLILDWDLGDFPGMADEETIISPVVHCGPHGLKLNKPAVLSYKHCAYDRGDVALVASETHLMQTKDWRQVCERDDSNKPYNLLPNEVQIQVSHFTLYTCLAEGKTATKKWMQLAVFGGRMRAKRRYEIRVYFLNNTPCALQFAIQNEAKNHFRQLCPRKEFLFHGDGEDIVAMIQHVNEGWSHRLDDRQELVPYLSLWHGKCPNVSFIFKHENEHVRDIDIRLAVYQRGREDNESEKTTLKVLASMKSVSARQNIDKSTGNTQAVIHVFPPSRHGKRRRFQSESSSSSRSDSFRSTSTESSTTSVSSNMSSCSSHPTSDTSENVDVTCKPEDQGKQQSCIQNMQIHIHPSSAGPLCVSTQRTIPHELCMELVLLLDPLAPLGNDWRVLASALEMDSLIPLLKNTPTYNPTETLLEEAERQAKSLEWMASVMMKAKRLDAANVIMKYANKPDSTCIQNES
ncbi:netrin receptor UNC5D-like [Patiria miniata]|uniref:Netrin receptor UNC5 n=1 Tax=Patiria miniata TaxID=46514 RepID=A0A914A5E1_PATMI|nr:netrin receptor UNC5D-like [Patiria miniata]